MTIDLNLILASAAVLAAIGSLIAVFGHKKSCRRAMEAADSTIWHIKKVCEDRAAELSSTVKTELQSEFAEALSRLEAGWRASERALGDGRISRSSRSEALRLLRSGMAPETAATTLGMPRNDLELLSKVAGILAVQ